MLPQPLPHLTPLDRAFWTRQETLETLWNVAVIILIYLVLRFILRRVVDRVVAPVLTQGEKRVDRQRAARLKTLAGLVNSIVSYTLIFVFGVMLLRAVHLDPIPLLTTASVAGLAVGFGAQKLVKDVISGFFILLEDQYAVGDYVTVNAVTGTVEDIGMRTTQIRDEAGRLYTLSNGDITLVCNQSRGAVASFIEIGIAANADLAKATDVINAAGQELAKDHPDLSFDQPPSIQGLGAMDAAKLTLRVACPVSTPAKLTDAQVALRGLIHQRLAEAEIGLG